MESGGGGGGGAGELELRGSAGDGGGARDVADLGETRASRADIPFVVEAWPFIDTRTDAH